MAVKNIITKAPQIMIPWCKFLQSFL